MYAIRIIRLTSYGKILIMSGRFLRSALLIFFSLTVLIHFYINRTTINPHYGKVFYKLGMECQNKCSLNKQLSYFRKAAFYDPTLGDAYYQLALIAEKNRDDATALQFYKKAAELDFTKYVAYFKVGVDYFKNRQWDYAIRYFKQSIRYKHNFSEAYYYLGRIYAIKEDYQSAIWHYEHAMDMKGDDLLEVYLRMGVVYHLWGSEAMALNYENKLRDLENNDLADQLKRFKETNQYPEYLARINLTK